VLVVDDSMLFRETLAKRLSEDGGIEVVATAGDPYSARDKIIEFEPDVMTLDVEMPRMSGIEFLKRLMPQHPIPTVMVSGLDDRVFEALNAGAVDFVAKVDSTGKRTVDSLIMELATKIKIASTARVGHWKTAGNNAVNRVKGSGEVAGQIIAIGASTGGTEATAKLLEALPKELPGIVIVQHMPPVFTRMYADRLNNNCLLAVKEAENGDRITPGLVLIAPGDQHMEVKKIGGGYQVSLNRSEKVNGHCPSVDVLFNSVAKAAGNKAVGVILTGMGADGAKGLLEMRKTGARTLGQDEESCVVYGMPKVAYDIGAVEKQYPLGSIAQALCSLF